MLGMGLLLILLFTGALIYWLAVPSYGLLFTQLDNQDANQILTQLEQDHIPYRVSNKGSDILIEKDLINKTRIKLMGSELGLTHSVGFELFDKTDFGLTDFSQKINYLRALQGELERTISSLDEVKNARVQLVIPENHLFQEANNVPKAAVTLHLNHPLTFQQIKSIQQLVTASVAHLSADNVIIVDQKGNGLTTTDELDFSSQFIAKKSLEQYLTDKVTQLLARLFTHENTVVKIDATLNYDELQRELIKPKNSGLITHEKSSHHSTTSSKKDKRPSNEEITSEKNYELGQEKERFTRASGTITRLTISVVLPKDTDSNQIAKIERLVKSVVGFDVNRGDSISVEALIQNVPTLKRGETIAPKQPRFKSGEYISSLGIGLFLLLGGFIHLRKRVKQKQKLLTELNQWLVEHG
jgi:flagellar M-ring protein FliF